MNTATITAPTPTDRSRPAWRGSPARVGALARAETRLLRRSPIALINAVGIPLGLAPLMADNQAMAGSAHGAAFLIGLSAVALLSAVYYNLVTAVVARREEMVLKRLRTGECSDAEILVATAVPAVTIAVVQIAAAAVAAALLLDLDAPADVVPVLLAIGLGAVVFVLLALVSTRLTPSVEMAQVTTLPGILVPMLLSGALFPISALPEWIRPIAPYSPLAPVVDLMGLGLTGTTTAESLGSLGSLLVLGGWIAFGVWATRRWLRWEPRQ